MIGPSTSNAKLAEILKTIQIGDGNTQDQFDALYEAIQRIEETLDEDM